MKSRREFIKTLSLLTVGAAAYCSFPSCINPKRLKGIQLWTLRDIAGKDPVGTLQIVTDIGFNNIEPYGFDGKFYGIEAREYGDMVRNLGARLSSTHTGISIENCRHYAEKAVNAGLEYLVLPSPGGRPVSTADDFKRIAEELNAIGLAVREAGLGFGYHNHAREFEPIDGIIPYDILLQETEPGLVCFEMDIYWIIKGGADPLDYFRKYPGRFELLHVKDMGQDGKSCIIGNGNINFKEIFALADIAGMKYFYLEQEDYEKSPVECVEESYGYIEGELV